MDQVNPHVPFLLPLLCPPIALCTHWEKLLPGLCDPQLLLPANAFGGKGILCLCTPSALLLAALLLPATFPVHVLEWGWELQCSACPQLLGERAWHCLLHPQLLSSIPRFSSVDRKMVSLLWGPGTSAVVFGRALALHFLTSTLLATRASLSSLPAPRCSCSISCYIYTEPF